MANPLQRSIALSSDVHFFRTAAAAAMGKSFNGSHVSSETPPNQGFPTPLPSQGSSRGIDEAYVFSNRVVKLILDKEETVTKLEDISPRATDKTQKKIIEVAKLSARASTLRQESASHRPSEKDLKEADKIDLKISKLMNDREIHHPVPSPRKLSKLDMKMTKLQIKLEGTRTSIEQVRTYKTVLAKPQELDKLESKYRASEIKILFKIIKVFKSTLPPEERTEANLSLNIEYLYQLHTLEEKQQILISLNPKYKPKKPH